MGSKNIQAYYNLVKPGLIYGNILTVIGGYLYGAILRPEFIPLIGVVVGSALTMACGTVLNNIQDRGMDQHMKRTKKRALVTGEISLREAIIYAIALGSIGLTLLATSTNALTVVLGIIGLVSYAGVYTFAKPRTVHATLLGTVPGAVPPLAGYVAATSTIDVSFWIILTTMICWQMVHFYAIATYRSKEYAAAKIPVMPISKGTYATKIWMVLFACGYLLSILALVRYSYGGLFYLAVMGVLATWWLIIVAGGIWTDDNNAWARKVFFISLALVTAWSVCLALNAWTP